MTRINPVKSKKGLPRRALLKELKLVATRKSQVPESMLLVRSPECASKYWRSQIERHPFISLETECLVALLLNTHLRVIGHSIISLGTVSANLVHSREVFRAAITAGASGVLLMHNHPSGESIPSQSDIEVTRTLREAGDILGIELLDHVVMGHKRYSSLGDMGYLRKIDGYERRLKS